MCVGYRTYNTSQNILSSDFYGRDYLRSPDTKLVRREACLLKWKRKYVFVFRNYGHFLIPELF